MQPRFNYHAPEFSGLMKAMYGLESYVRNSGLEHSLLELVKVRASQINACAFCLDMHTKDARAAGETEQRLYGLSAWREAPYYTERERAALAWTEAVTLISQHDITDHLFSQLQEQFTDHEIVQLTMAVVTINGWNRLAITARAEAGSYQPAQAA